LLQDWIVHLDINMDVGTEFEPTAVGVGDMAQWATDMVTGLVGYSDGAINRGTSHAEATPDPDSADTCLRHGRQRLPFQGLMGPDSTPMPSLVPVPGARGSAPQREVGGRRATVHLLPDELLHVIFRLLDASTLLVAVPRVCRRWWAACGGTPHVDLDFTVIPAYVKHCADANGEMMLADIAQRFPRAVRLNLEQLQKVADDSIVAVAPHLPLLTSVNLSGCRYLGAAAVTALADHCPLLTAVDFACCALTDDAIVALAQQCRHLTLVDLWGSNRLTAAAIEALAAHSRRLTSITIGPSCTITDASVIALAKGCPLLTHAKFNRCLLLGDSAVVGLTSHCQLLASLDFEACERVTDKCVAALPQRQPPRRLTSINFQACDRLTDRCVASFAVHCPLLERVDFALCARITDQGVLSLAAHCPNLTALNVSKCPRVTDAVVAPLHKACVRLHNVSGVPNWPPF
jgi:hypothetical protein